MRNKKLLYLTEQARAASESLTDYLRHLDARETDSSYQHARMLFDEGWRLRSTLTPDWKPLLPPCNVSLWMDTSDTDELDVSPVTIVADNLNDVSMRNALQLADVPSTNEVLTFLAELTDEIGVYPPPKPLAENQ